MEMELKEKWRSATKCMFCYYSITKKYQQQWQAIDNEIAVKLTWRLMLPTMRRTV